MRKVCLLALQLLLLGCLTTFLYPVGMVHADSPAFIQIEGNNLILNNRPVVLKVKAGAVPEAHLAVRQTGKGRVEAPVLAPAWRKLKPSGKSRRPYLKPVVERRLCWLRENASGSGRHR